MFILLPSCQYVDLNMMLFCIPEIIIMNEMNQLAYLQAKLIIGLSPTSSFCDVTLGVIGGLITLLSKTVTG